jgi:hypothetical protein
MRAKLTSANSQDWNPDCGFVPHTPSIAPRWKGDSVGADLAASDSARRFCYPRWILIAAFFVFATTASVASSPNGASDRVARDLRTWASVMEMFRTDDGTYPETTSIAGHGAMAKARGYWSDPSVVDEKGRAYLVRAERGSYRISSRSGELVDGAIDLAPADDAGSSSTRPDALAQPPATSSPGSSAPDAPGTILSVNKSGGDVVLSWSGTGTVFAGAEATDGPFANTNTLFGGLGGLTYTYVGAVSNSRVLELFDVSDETETNRGGNWNAECYPPPHPRLTPRTRQRISGASSSEAWAPS